MHYWLRSINGGQFRLVNFSFYPRPNISDRFPSNFIFVGDKMNTSQSTQLGKRYKLNSFKYFTQVTGALIFAKHQFQLSNLDFTMKSASLSNAILTFFLGMAYIFILQKIVAQGGRLQLCRAFAVILVKYSAPTSSNFFLCKIVQCLVKVAQYVK